MYPAGTANSDSQSEPGTRMRSSCIASNASYWPDAASSAPAEPVSRSTSHCSPLAAATVAEPKTTMALSPVVKSPIGDKNEQMAIAAPLAAPSRLKYPSKDELPLTRRLIPTQAVASQALAG